jgi:hypothetical protein
MPCARRSRPVIIFSFSTSKIWTVPIPVLYRLCTIGFIYSKLEKVDAEKIMPGILALVPYCCIACNHVQSPLPQPLAK